jgi:phospholipid/cholesterol/gamma-HCH transport system ATP-binding protein
MHAAAPAAAADAGEVLSFAAAELPVEDEPGQRTPPLSLTLLAGDLALVDVADGGQLQLLADAACGLIAVRNGGIRLLGRDWRELTATQAAALRGRIGHVFAAPAWLPNLSLADNMLLSQLHHTRRTWRELREEAAALAAHFGLPGLPVGTADTLTAIDRQRAACVRAFLGRPSLVIIETPPEGIVPDLLEPLVDVVRTVRDRDAAVLWLSMSAAVWADPSLPASARLRFRNNALMAADSGR